MRRSARELESTAYHEAGHAVIAMHFRRAIRYVTIEATDTSYGHVLKTPMPPSFDPQNEIDARTMRRIEAEILVSLAGLAAESRFTGRRNLRAASGDYRFAVEMAAYAYNFGPVAGKYVEFLEARAMQLMAGPAVWVKVEAMAKALLAHKRLDAKQARAIYAGAVQDAVRLRQLEREEIAREEAESAALIRGLAGA